MKRNNNFDLLRLLFAALVIVSHSPQLMYGDNSPREPLMGLFGTVTLGELAVEGFFVISGYLITMSYEKSRSVHEYLLKRVLRIYPGFLVAFFLSYFVVGWLGGGDLQHVNSADGLKIVLHALALHAPDVPGAFAGLPVPSVNGSMWTISYEFRCYLLVIAFGAIGLLRWRRAMLGLAVALIALSVAGVALTTPHALSVITGTTEWLFEFLAYFCTGSAFYLYRERIPYRPALAGAAAVALCGFLFIPHVAQGAAAIFGGYLIFWFALSVRSRFVDWIRPQQDISYGLYLYGWPVQILIVYWFRELSPWVVSAATLAIAGLLGGMSWILVERPALRLKEAKVGRREAASARSALQ